VFDYLEMEDRIAVLNARLAILHELLDMLRIQGQAQHSDFLEASGSTAVCKQHAAWAARMAWVHAWLEAVFVLPVLAWCGGACR
jgi:hypothetical protein